MLPTLYEGTNGLSINSYGLLIMLAFSAAFLVTHTRSMAAGIAPLKLMPVYLAAAAGGLAGGRILYSVAVSPGLMGLLTDPLSLFQGSGFAFYGGLIGGFLAVAAVAIPQGIPPWKLADIAAPSVLIGYGVGRMGCFFAGCCHGVVAPIGEHPIVLGANTPLDGIIRLSAPFPWLSLEFHGGVGDLLNQPLYPTQLYAVAVGTLGCAAMLALWEKRRFDGQFAALYLILEPPTRFLIECFRADPRGYALTFPAPEWVGRTLPGMAQAGADLPPGWVGLTTSQTIGVGMVLIGGLIYAARRNAGVAPEIPYDPDAAFDEELPA